VSAVTKSRRRPKAGGHRAEHPGCPIPVTWYSSSSLSSKNQVNTSEQQGGGACHSEVKKEAEGRVTRTTACTPARLRPSSKIRLPGCSASCPPAFGLLLYLRRTPRQPDPGDLVFECEKPSQHSTTHRQGGGARQSEVKKEALGPPSPKQNGVVNFETLNDA